MDFDRALGMVSQVFQQKVGRPLTEAEIVLISGAWQQWPYDRCPGTMGTIAFLNGHHAIGTLSGRNTAIAL